MSERAVRDRARERRHTDRRERGGHRLALAQARDEDQEWNGDDASADAEEGAEDADGDPESEEPRHAPSVSGVRDHDLLAELARLPPRGAVLLDVDGTLAPIVARPEDARVPEETRAVLRGLRDRYALVACVSGRAGVDAQRIVRVEGLIYVGEHGLELEPEAERWAPRLAAFADRTGEWPAERKRLTLAYHWRTAADETEALGVLEGIAGRAAAEGLVVRWGRKVLELRPPVAADKGTAVRRLLGERGLTRALYAGDDTTDLDAFRALDGLELGVRVAVASAEAPPGLRESADIVVGTTEELRELLARL